MGERANHNWFNILSGGVEGAVGLVAFVETYAIREGLKLSNQIPGLEGVNWQYYADISAKLGKPVVDGLISYGADLGGALALIGICEILHGVDEHDAQVMSPVINFATAGVMGLVGVVLEVHELIMQAPIDQCANVGCGSFGDLLIFSGLLAYPFIRQYATNRNSK